jgi:predicted nucleic acid-binding Zn ribbon protein
LNREPTKEAVHIGRVIDRLLKTYRHESDSELSRIWSLWDGLVGDVIAAHARPHAIKGRLLLVYVTNSSWLHQLMFLKQDIIKKINKSAEKEILTEIKFKIGSIRK